MKHTLLSFICLLLILLPLTSCALGRKQKNRTDYFSIIVDEKGYIKSMKNTTVQPNREFSPADRPSPLLSLYDSQKNKYYMPIKANYNNQTSQFTLKYPNGSLAEITLQPLGKYFKLTLNSLEPRNTRTLHFELDRSAIDGNWHVTNT